MMEIAISVTGVVIITLCVDARQFVKGFASKLFEEGTIHRNFDPESKFLHLFPLIIKQT